MAKRFNQRGINYPREGTSEGSLERKGGVAPLDRSIRPRHPAVSNLRDDPMRPHTFRVYFDDIYS
jgi:hypothetical protein